MPSVGEPEWSQDVDDFSDELFYHYQKLFSDISLAANFERRHRNMSVLTTEWHEDSINHLNSLMQAFSIN